MRLLIIGSGGTIGNYVTQHFESQHEVVRATRSAGDVQIDINDERSIRAGLEKVGTVDAIVVAAGEAHWDALERMSEEDFYIGIKSKLMGQVNVVRHGLQYLSKGGSITLTTGILADDPVVMTTSAAMVNGALHSFVKAVNLELSDGKRVNVVCPGLVEPSAEKYADYFPGHDPVSMKRVVNGYAKSVLGKGSGEIIRVY